MKLDDPLVTVGKYILKVRTTKPRNIGFIATEMNRNHISVQLLIVTYYASFWVNKNLQSLVQESFVISHSNMVHDTTPYIAIAEHMNTRGSKAYKIH